MGYLLNLGYVLVYGVYGVAYILYNMILPLPFKILYIYSMYLSLTMSYIVFYVLKATIKSVEVC